MDASRRRAACPAPRPARLIVGGIERDDPSRLIEHFDALDVLVVVDDDGLWSVDASTLDGRAVVPPLDPLTPVSRLVGPLPQGERVLDADGARRRSGCRARRSSPACCSGMAEASTDLAVAYAKERVQFDRPIGVVPGGEAPAGRHVHPDRGGPRRRLRGRRHPRRPGRGSVERAVAAAKLTAAEAAVGNGKTCIQVHGGMGYTWEVDAHLFFKRAYALEPLFGSREDCADTMADLLDTALA